jgi:hypothetical protein
MSPSKDLYTLISRGIKPKGQVNKMLKQNGHGKNSKKGTWEETWKNFTSLPG